eukprot:m.178956 g.178956  ORF g.178956 m.178956 type:complete len:50 (+) comp39199_c0_seq8:716-865(+)
MENSKETVLYILLLCITTVMKDMKLFQGTRIGCVRAIGVGVESYSRADE